jgi:hypothetical protein
MEMAILNVPLAGIVCLQEVEVAVRIIHLCLSIYLTSKTPIRVSCI